MGVGSGEDSSNGRAAFGLQNPRLAAIIRLEVLFQTLQVQRPNYLLLSASSNLFDSSRTMSFIDLNSIQFYQPPVKADVAKKTTSTASTRDISAVCKEGKGLTVSGYCNSWDRRLQEYDLIECVDFSENKSLSLCDEPAFDLSVTETNFEGMFRDL